MRNSGLIECALTARLGTRRRRRRTLFLVGASACSRSHRFRQTRRSACGSSTSATRGLGWHAVGAAGAGRQLPLHRTDRRLARPGIPAGLAGTRRRVSRCRGLPARCRKPRRRYGWRSADTRPSFSEPPARGTHSRGHSRGTARRNLRGPGRDPRAGAQPPPAHRRRTGAPQLRIPCDRHRSTGRTTGGARPAIAGARAFASR